jgi:hypothetical protein
MTNVVTKQVQNKMSNYFSKLSGFLYKPESRCVREMVTGILKSGTVLINQIASGIGDKIPLSKTTKRFRNHYNKEGFFQKLFKGHLQSVKGKICHGDYILVDGSDIQKKYAKMMEGLDYVKDGDQGSIGLGYWLMDIVHFGKDGEMTPLINKLYSFDNGAKSENLEVKDAVEIVRQEIEKRLKYIYDRGMDREILRDFIIGNGDDFILRLKKTTKLLYRGKELKVGEIAKKLPLFMELSATKAGKNKRYKKQYSCGAVKVKYQINGQLHDLWLVVTKNQGGGYCFLLTRTSQESIIEIVKETFKAYGFRWKIEEYHRHIKDSYKLEDIQVKTFEGLQSMLAILTITMSIIYRELASMHIRLLLESGIKTLNKEKIYELYNFIYYKISKILKVLLAHVKPKAFLPDIQNRSNQLQLKLVL